MSGSLDDAVAIEPKHLQEVGQQRPARQRGGSPAPLSAAITRLLASAPPPQRRGSAPGAPPRCGRQSHPVRRHPPPPPWSVPLPPPPQVLARLTDRRIAVEKELSALGEAKKGANDIFRHCRGFERAYSLMLQVGGGAVGALWGVLEGRRQPAASLRSPAGSVGSAHELGGLCSTQRSHRSPPAMPTLPQEANTAFKIRAVVEGTLPDSLHKIPIEKRFTKDYVRNVSGSPSSDWGGGGRRGGHVPVPRPPASCSASGCPAVVLPSPHPALCRPPRPPTPSLAQICREADGYRPHLVSPEKGIKQLVQEAMKQTSPFVHKFVDEIHLVLQETVRAGRSQGGGWVQPWVQRLPAPMSRRRRQRAWHSRPANSRAARLLLGQSPAHTGTHALCPRPPARAQVREAARRSVLTEAGISDVAAAGGKSMDFLRLKGFENAVIMAANRALEEWREEAHKGARRARPGRDRGRRRGSWARPAGRRHPAPTCRAAHPLLHAPVCSGGDDGDDGVRLRDALLLP